MTESGYKTGLYVALFISLLLYHLTSVFKSKFVSPVSDIFSLADLVQIAITILVFSLVVYNKLVIRLILRNEYIDGEYEGTSQALNKPLPQPGIERFVISQNLFEVSITGKSFEGDRLLSTWTGRLFKREGNTYYFGLELSTTVREFGVLILTMEEHGIVHGFYYPGNPQIRQVFIISAKRKKRSLLADVFRW